MRVFILGTGRCGSMPCAKAASHVTNFTSAHESNILPDFHFPDNHIEVSPRLTWVLSSLGRVYPDDDTFWVHLVRRREEVIASWIKRGPHRGAGYWRKLVWSTSSVVSYKKACGMCYDAMHGQIEDFLDTRVRTFRIRLEHGAEDWGNLWSRIHAEGDFEASEAEWKTKYNAAK